MRGVSRHRHVLGEDAAFPPEPGRYHLFVALNCPWCHRVTLARNVLGLQDPISMDVAFPGRTDDDDPAGDGKLLQVRCYRFDLRLIYWFFSHPNVEAEWRRTFCIGKAKR